MEEERVFRKRRSEEELMAEFGWRQKEQWRSRRVVVNFHKAKGVLEQLENKEVVVEVKNDDDGGENEENEEEEEVITEEVLFLNLSLFINVYTDVCICAEVHVL